MCQLGTLVARRERKNNRIKKGTILLYHGKPWRRAVLVVLKRIGTVQEKKMLYWVSRCVLGTNLFICWDAIETIINID